MYNLYKFLNKKEGFTLIEMLVAIASAFIIMSVLFSIVLIMITSQRNALAKKELSNNSRVILETMTRHIRLASKDLNIQSFQNQDCVENNFYFATFEYDAVFSGSKSIDQNIIDNNNYIQFLSTIEDNQCIRFYRGISKGSDEGELILSTKDGKGDWKNESLTSNEEVIIDSLKFKVLNDDRLNHPTVLIYLELKTATGEGARFENEISLRAQTSITPRNVVSRQDIVRNLLGIVDVYIKKRVHSNSTECSYIFEVFKNGPVNNVDVDLFSREFPDLPKTPSSLKASDSSLKYRFDDDDGENAISGDNARKRNSDKNGGREFIYYDLIEKLKQIPSTYFFQPVIDDCEYYKYFRVKARSLIGNYDYKWTEGYPHNIENVVGNFLYDSSASSIPGIEVGNVIDYDTNDRGGISETERKASDKKVKATVKITPITTLGITDTDVSYNIKYCQEDYKTTGSRREIENCFENWEMLRCDVESDGSGSTQLSCYDASGAESDPFPLNANKYGVEIDGLEQAQRYIFEVNAEYIKDGKRYRTIWNSQEIATEIEPIYDFSRVRAGVDVLLQWKHPNIESKVAFEYDLDYTIDGAPVTTVEYDSESRTNPSDGIKISTEGVISYTITGIGPSERYADFVVKITATVPLASDTSNDANTVEKPATGLNGFTSRGLTGFKYYLPGSDNNKQPPACERIGSCPSSCRGSSGRCRIPTYTAYKECTPLDDTKIGFCDGRPPGVIAYGLSSSDLSSVKCQNGCTRSLSCSANISCNSRTQDCINHVCVDKPPPPSDPGPDEDEGEGEDEDTGEGDRDGTP